MALSGTITGSYHSKGNYRIKLVWSATQDISNNRSTITVKTYLDADWSVSYSATKSGSTTVDGQTQTWSDSTNHSGTGEWLLATRTFIVSHNSDGTKSLNISGWFDLNISTGNGYVGRLSASRSITLNTIPRASTISSFPNFNIDSSFTVTISRASSSFTHKLVMYQGNDYIGEWSGIGTSTTINLTSSQENDIYNNIPNSTNTTITLYCYTYNGSTQIGNRTYKTSMAYVPSNIKPSFSYIFHSEYVSSIASKFTSYIQSKSRVKISINGASGSKYSTIKSYKIEFNGQVFNSPSATSDYIKGSGNLTIKCTVTDSRNRSYSSSINISALAYVPPKITSFKVDRCDLEGTLNEDGTYANVTIKGNYSSLNGKNTKSLKVYSKERNISIYDELGNYQPSSSFSISYVYGTYEKSKSYDFKSRLADYFTSIDSDIVLTTAEVVMDLGRNGIGVGKYHEGLANLEVSGDIIATGRLSADWVNTEYIGSIDNRGINRKPTDYPKSRGMFNEFKYQDIIEIPYSWRDHSYCHLLTLKPWGDSSGGNIKQLAFTETSIYYRTSDRYVDWNSWQKVWTSWNDGVGSGLNADKLDGLEGSAYAKINGGQTFTNVDWTLIGGGSLFTLQSSYNGASNYMEFREYDGSRKAYFGFGSPSNLDTLYIYNDEGGTMHFLGSSKYNFDSTIYSNGSAISSQRQLKEKVLTYDKKLAYDIIKDITPYIYKRKGRLGSQLGVMVEDSPLEILTFDGTENEGKHIDLYSWSTLNTSAIQELQDKVERIELEIQELRGVVDGII